MNDRNLRAAFRAFTMGEAQMNPNLHLRFIQEGFMPRNPACLIRNELAYAWAMDCQARGTQLKGKEVVDYLFTLWAHVEHRQTSARIRELWDHAAVIETRMRREARLRA